LFKNEREKRKIVLTRMVGRGATTVAARRKKQGKEFLGFTAKAGNAGRKKRAANGEEILSLKEWRKFKVPTGTHRILILTGGNHYASQEISLKRGFSWGKKVTYQLDQS